MKKRYFFILLAIILTIAYFDLVDTCRQLDKVVSDMIKLDSEIQTKIDTTQNFYIKISNLFPTQKH